MITAGIDVGLAFIKIVIQKDGEVLARTTGPAGGAKRAAATERLWNEALDAAGIKAAEVGKVFATGQGKKDIAFADDNVAEPIADARAARFLCPEATSVVDIGADQTRVVTLDGEKVSEVVLNQKCAAGAGIFLTYMARRLGMSIDELAALNPADSPEVNVNDGCPVFAELDAQSLLNRSVPVKDVARAVIRSVAVRLSSILDDKVRPSKTSTLLMGGVSKNGAVVRALRERSGIDFIIPEQAEYGGALGAALLAAE